MLISYFEYRILTRPDAEGSTLLALDTITDGNYHIKAIIGHRLFDTINTQKMRIVILRYFFC